MVRAPNVLFLSAVEPSGDRLGACLVRALKGGADVNRDRVITAKELFSAVSKGVKELSDNRQHPVMWGNFPDDMPVMVWK